MKHYKIFVRNWWKINPNWPDRREPDPRARKKTIAYASSEEEARKICREYNDSHNPGKLSRKAEYTSI